MLARLGRVVLIVAVLLAQQTALAHDFWHATTGQAAAETPKAPKGDKLCDLHDLLGTVLGVLSAGIVAQTVLAFSEVDFIAFASGSADAAPVSAQSRSPPLNS
jgi:hypothetical protein